MVQKDSVNTSRPCASLTTMQSSGSSCIASLLQFSNNPSGKPACLFFILQDSALRIAILPEFTVICRCHLESACRGTPAYTPRGDTIIVLCGHAYGERATAAQSADRRGVNAEGPCDIDQSFAISEALECLLALVLV